MRHERALDIPEAIRVLLVPLDGHFEPVVEGDELPPPKAVKLRTVDRVPEIVETTVGHEGDEGVLAFLELKDVDQALRDLEVGQLVGPTDVVDLAQLALEQDEFECARHIGHVEEIPGVRAGPVQGHAPPPEELVGELRDELLRVLVRPVHVVPAGHDYGEVERAVVRFDQELGRGLGGGVRVGRLEDVLLAHGVLVGFALPVYLVRGHVHEALDSMNLRRLQKNVRAVDVVLRELERVAEGVVDMRLGGEVHDGVDLLRLEDVVHQVGRADIALDELVVRAVVQAVQVLQAGHVIELVEVHNSDVRVFLRKKNHRVACDEPSPARNHDNRRLEVIRRRFERRSLFPHEGILRNLKIVGCVKSSHWNNEKRSEEAKN
mmetsp:Transcript_5044/g.11863  ORF Transcript_5044/g.11863 Transcript_5044/m.11863 type:complete len:377 (-) Transcript_5044:10-1140(-)